MTQTIHYIEEKRVAQVGEKVKIVAPENTGGAYKKGNEFYVEKSYKKYVITVEGMVLCHAEYVVLTPAVPAKQLEEVLSLVANLSTRLQHMEKREEILTGNVMRLAERIGEEKTRIDGIEARVLPPDIAVAERKLTRRDVVLDARNSVEYWNVNGKYAVIEDRCDIEFVVDRDKRTVVALKRSWDTKKVVWRGIAKCMPGDVFNADIGKAIALYRALGMEVPSKYTDSPKPEGVQVGDVVVANFSGNTGEKTVKIVSDDEEIILYETVAVGSILADHGRVIDDTDRAEYNIHS